MPTSHKRDEIALKALILLTDGEQLAALIAKRGGKAGDVRLCVYLRRCRGEYFIVKPRAVEHAREGCNVRHLHALTLAAGGLKLRRAQFRRHAPAVDNAVMRGEAGELVENVA